MRIISQCGFKDCEYNGNLLELELTKDGGMLFREKMYGRTLGQYLSKEKALKVMEMIRNNNCTTEYFYMPKDKEVDCEKETKNH